MVLTPKSHAEHTVRTGEFLHIHVNGVDVTTRCSKSDDVEGWADVFIIGADGRFQADPATGTAKTEHLTGAVVYVPVSATPGEIEGAKSLVDSYQRR